MNQAQRRAHNLALALNCVRCNVPVFPVDGVTKAPLHRLFHTLDTAITPAQRQDIIDDGGDPKRAGSTLTEKVVKLWWRQNPDAVPGISGGLFNAVVFDCDVNDGTNGKRVKDGVNLFDAWWREHVGVIPMHPVTVTPSGGRHHYLGSAAIGCGVLTHLDTDVKGAGGFTIAPGAIRVDGKRYEAAPGTPDLLASIRDLSLVACPEALARVYADRASMRQHGEDTEPRIAAAQRELEAGRPDDVAALDLASLRAKDPEFRGVMDTPTGDHSRDRFTVARCLLREFGPACTVHHLADAYDDWDGAGSFLPRKDGEGTYDNREIARNFVRAQGSGKVVTGESFGDVSKLVEGAEQPAAGGGDGYDSLPDEKPAKPKKAGLVFETDADFLAGELPEVDWLVEDLIESVTSILLYGAPGAGKTAVLIDMLLCIAYGLPWGGRKTKGCPVLLVCPEGPNGLVRRIRAWFKRKAAQGVTLEPGRLIVVRQAVDLFGSDAGLDLVGAELVRRDKLGQRVGLTVFDTLRKAMPGGNENDPTDVSLLMSRVDRLRAACRCATLLVHHSGKDKEKGASGSTAIIGSVDTALVIEKKKKTDKHGLILPDKLRDGDMPETGIRYDLTTEELGESKDGKTVRAVVAVIAAPAKAQPAASDGSAMGAVEDPDDEPETAATPAPNAAPAADEPENGGHADPERLALLVSAVRDITESQTAPGCRAQEIEDALNAKLRKAKGKKAEIARATLRRLLADAIEDGVLVRSGSNRATLYRLGP